MSLQTVKPQQKYGLISKKVLPQARKPISKLSVFGNDELEEDDDKEEQQINRVSKIMETTGNRLAKEAEKIHANAIVEDASVFDYDGSYDTFKRESAQPSIKASEPKSQYIDNLKAIAKVRELEKDRVYERRLLKERKIEDEQFGDTPQFVTSAYKLKLMEEKKWQYEDRIAEEVEKQTDVRTSGMQGFYANLLTKNVSMGGDVAKSALSAYTAGSSRQATLMGTEAGRLDETTEQENGGGGREELPEQDVEQNKKGDDRNSQSIASNRQESSSSSNSSGNNGGGGSELGKRTASSQQEITHETTTTTSAAVSAEDKQAVIQSAKERFMARKKAALEKS